MGGIGDDVLRRRRLVVAHIVGASGISFASEAASTPAMSIDVDAAEHLPRLDIRSRLPSLRPSI